MVTMESSPHEAKQWRLGWDTASSEGQDISPRSPRCDPPALTFSSGTHLCEVEIDPETGALTIGRYTIVEDCGRMLNPRVVEGQLHGATAQGIGGAMCEEVVYTADGQNLSATYLDYAVPTASAIVPAAGGASASSGPRSGDAAGPQGHGGGRGDGRLGGDRERGGRRAGARSAS